MCNCIQQEMRFMIATLCTSFIAFFTTAFYLNELSNTAVPIATRFDGSYEYALLSAKKAMVITSYSRESMDPDIQYFTGSIVVASYAIVVNFFHFVFSLVYVMQRPRDKGKICCADYSLDHTKPGDYPRFVGSVFALIIVAVAVVQSVLALWSIGVIIPSFFPDTMAFTIFVSCIALNPPAIKKKIGNTIEAAELNNPGATSPRQFESDNKILFSAYLIFLVLGCFYTIANYVIDSGWRVYNDASVICETNSTRLFNKHFQYLIQNDSFSGVSVVYTLLEPSFPGSTSAFYCIDGVFEIIIVACLLCTTLSHFSMLKSLYEIK